MYYRMWSLFSHATIIFSLLFIVLCIIDKVNPAMQFLSSGFSKWVLLFYCFMALQGAICSAVHLFKRKYHKKKQEITHS